MNTKVKILATAALTTIGVLMYANFSEPQKELKYNVGQPTPVTDPHFAKILGDLMGPAFREGNSIRTLKNGEEIFPAMLKAIRSARKSITFESFIYWSGKVGEEFVEALSERARGGVKVHVLIDWVGSDKIEEAYIRRMKSSGVQVERYHELAWYNLARMNNRTHRKILVIDGEVGFTGGVGIADEWDGDGLDPKHWRDTHFEVRGPVVAQMQSAFLDNWMKVRPEVHHGYDYFPDLAPTPGGMNVKAQMFKSSSREGSSSVHIMYLLALAAAKESIFLESAYFVPDDVTIQELLKARRRGVHIEIIVPSEKTDSAIVRHASRELWGELLQAGVKFFEYQKAMFHCKVLVIDGHFVSIGSTNFDERSFKLNDEANLNVLDSEFASEQLRIFEEDKSRSKEITYENWKQRPWTEKLTEKVAITFRSQL